MRTGPIGGESRAFSQPAGCVALTMDGLAAYKHSLRGPVAQW